MFKGLSVTIHPGKKMPAEYAQKVLAEYPTYMGAAIPMEGDPPEVWVEHFKDPEQLTPESIDTIVDNASGKACVLFFASAPDQVAENDYQPFVLLKDGDRVVAAVAIEGEYHSFEQTQSAISNEYHAFEKYLLPKIEDIYNTVEKDVTRLIERMQTPVVQHDLNNVSAGRGAISVLFCNGEVLQFGRNTKAGEFSWGYTTNFLDYKENVGEVHLKEAAASKPHPRSMLAKAKAAATTATEAVKAAVTPAPRVVPEKSQTAIGAALAEAELKRPTPKALFVKCPDGVTGKVNIRNWYKTKLGYEPQNTDQRPKVTVTDMGTVLKLINEAGKIHKPWTEQGIYLPPVDRPVQGEDTEQPDEKAARSGPQPNDKQVVTDVVPVLSPKSKQAVEEWMKDANVAKCFDIQGTEIPDPSSLPGWDVKGADFASIAKRKDINEFLRLPFAALLELGRADVMALAKLCNDLKVAKYRDNKRIEALVRQLPSTKHAQRQAG